MTLEESTPTSARALVSLFLVALAMRWVYVITFYAVFGLSGLQGPDSGGYLDTGRKFAETIAAGKTATWAWLGPDPALMPLYTWTMALNAAVAGESAPLSITLVQGLFDSVTCLFIAGIARLIAPRAALLAGYAAAFTPTFIVLSGIVYTDTLFVFFVAASLYTALRWLKAQGLKWALLLGACVTCALGRAIGDLPRGRGIVSARAARAHCTARRQQRHPRCAPGAGYGPKCEPVQLLGANAAKRQPLPVLGRVAGQGIRRRHAARDHKQNQQRAFRDALW
jgi:hypothetical protein